ncbi:MAG: AsmA family protein [Candidatus Acidiferrales bacterium]
MSAPVTTAASRKPSRRRVFRRLLWLLVLLVAGFVTVSLALRNRRIASALERRLSASVGRSVDVGHFDVSLWEGLQLRANFVNVEEDPRFGHEYFLLAERVTAGLRWTALFSGRIEFDSLVLTRPSLNLVRNADGQWNLENWLPWPADASQAATPPSAPASAVRFQDLRIRNGRINFKRGPDKHPFAVVGVDGAVERAGEGRWEIDVTGHPMRSGVMVQQPGMIHVRGRLGGTSARLRPADLAVRWQQVSLSDALRLLAGFDYGVRGQLDIEGRIGAPAPAADQPAGSLWRLAGVARLTGMHRWDLPPRDSDPSVNLVLDAQWWPALARAEVTRAAIEAPGSLVRGFGFAQWGRPPAHTAVADPPLSPGPDSQFHFVSSGISLNDLFRWYPAFRPGVPPEILVEGHTGMDLLIEGWPPRIERLVMATGGARMRVPGVTEALAMTGTVLRYGRTRGRVDIGPAMLRLGAPGAAATSLRLEASAAPGAPWKFRSSVSGQVGDTQALLHAASALGFSAPRRWAAAGWQAQGSADVRLAWQGTLFPFAAAPQGDIRLRRARLSTPALSDAIAIGSASIELYEAGNRIDLQNVRALGATWNGSLRSRGSEPWDFSLDADALDLSVAHRWLVPGGQPSLLQRLAVGKGPRASLPDALGGLRARGRIQVQQLRIAPFALGALRGRVTLDASTPWRLELDEAQAAFFGGSVAGVFAARGSASELARQDSESSGARAPHFQADLRLRGVNLAALAATMPRLRGLFSGVASGSVAVAARGFNREALLASLTANGSLQLTAAHTTLLDLPASLRAGRAMPGATSFPFAGGRFLLARGRIALEEVQLFVPRSRPSFPDWLMSGEVDPRGREITLDLRLAAPAVAQPAILASDLTRPNVLAASPAQALGSRETPRRQFRLRGPLRSIELTAQPAATQP